MKKVMISSLLNKCGQKEEDRYCFVGSRLELVPSNDCGFDLEDACFYLKDEVTEKFCLEQKQEKIFDTESLVLVGSIPFLLKKNPTYQTYNIEIEKSINSSKEDGVLTHEVSFNIKEDSYDYHVTWTNIGQYKYLEQDVWNKLEQSWVFYSSKNLNSSLQISLSQDNIKKTFTSIEEVLEEEIILIPNILSVSVRISENEMEIVDILAKSDIFVDKILVVESSNVVNVSIRNAYIYDRIQKTYIDTTMNPSIYKIKTLNKTQFRSLLANHKSVSTNPCC